jgi:hypothetical protein
MSRPRINSWFALAVLVGGALGCGQSAPTAKAPPELAPDEVARLSHFVSGLSTIPQPSCVDIIASDRFDTFTESVRRLIQQDAERRGLPVSADSAYAYGFAKAVADVREGTLIYHHVGSPKEVTDHRGVTWKRDVVMEDVLLRDYGIRTVFWGEATTTPQWAFLCGYNSVFDAVQLEAFGRDVVAEASLNVLNEIASHGRGHRDRWQAQ